MSDTALTKTGGMKGEMVAIGREIKNNARTLFGLLAIFWALEIADFILAGISFDAFGIHPRSIGGLLGIPAAPFLHGGFGHLAANSVPFAVLGGMLMLRDRKDFWAASVFSTFIGGMGVWLIGAANSVHIGASIVIFGFLGYLLSLGYFERKLSSILLSVFVGLAYGGMIFGVLPTTPGISWEGHLFGFIGGVVGAWATTNATRKNPKLLTE